MTKLRHVLAKRIGETTSAEVASSVTANIPRPDLVDAGFAGGNHGFEIDLASNPEIAISDNWLREFSVLGNDATTSREVYGSPRQYACGDEIEVVGPEVVFDSATQRCVDTDIPDLPARAWRDAGGQVNLVASHTEARPLVGPDFSHLTHSCTSLHSSGLAGAPESFNNEEWVTATYQEGGTLHALIYNEFHGRPPGYLDEGSPYFTSRQYLPVSMQDPPGSWPGCWAGLAPGAPPSTWDSSSIAKCWYSGITAATRTGTAPLTAATAGGSNPTARVALPPYQWVDGLLAPPDGPLPAKYGFGATSNIVKDGTYYYALVRSLFPPLNDYRYLPFFGLGKQRAGVCVMRTDNLSDPLSWRSWTGSSYSGTFTVPYPTQPGSPDSFNCTTVMGTDPESQEEGSVDGLVGGLVRSNYLGGKFVAVDTTIASSGGVYAFYYATSTNLTSWYSPPATNAKRIMIAPMGLTGDLLPNFGPLGVSPLPGFSAL